MPVLSPEDWNVRSKGFLPGFLGVTMIRADLDGVLARLEVEVHHMAPNGFLHAGTIVTLADTCCGYSTVNNLPDGAAGFTTIELKSNHLSTVRDGAIVCETTPVHRGRTTHVWDATVRAENTEKIMALFRCTQMILWPK